MKTNDAEIEQLAIALSRELNNHNGSISTVESCTGGLVAALLTGFAGSSAWFDRGFVTYSNQAKVDMVGVNNKTLLSYGAVSEQVALEMAKGGIKHSKATCALSITGIAGPSGGSIDKPVGTVCFAWMGWTSTGISQTRLFVGNRDQIRQQSVTHAICTALTLFTNS